jgi:hypothetical protein
MDPCRTIYLEEKLEKFNKWIDIETKEIFNSIVSLKISIGCDKYFHTLSGSAVALIISGQCADKYTKYYANIYSTEWIEHNMERVIRVLSYNNKDIYYYSNKLYFIEDLSNDVINKLLVNSITTFSQNNVFEWPYQFSLHCF